MQLPKLMVAWIFFAVASPKLFAVFKAQIINESSQKNLEKIQKMFFFSKKVLPDK
jgi:hypothetical protein